jgi:hypothetical protein
MQTGYNRKQVEEKRCIDIENLVGNLFIAEYQVYERRARLSDIVSGYGPKILKHNNTSKHIFEHNNKLYKLSL